MNCRAPLGLWFSEFSFLSQTWRHYRSEQTHSEIMYTVPCQMKMKSFTIKAAMFLKCCHELTNNPQFSWTHFMFFFFLLLLAPSVLYVHNFLSQSNSNADEMCPDMSLVSDLLTAVWYCILYSVQLGGLASFGCDCRMFSWDEQHRWGIIVLYCRLQSKRKSICFASEKTRHWPDSLAQCHNPSFCQPSADRNIRYLLLLLFLNKQQHKNVWKV